MTTLKRRSGTPQKFLACLLFAAASLAAQEPKAAAGPMPAEIAGLGALLDEGKGQLKNDRPKDARRTFAKADQLAGGKSTAALIGLASAHLQLKEAAPAGDAARRGLAVADNDADRGALLTLEGLAWYQLADGRADLLTSAAAKLEQAIGLGAANLYSTKLTLAATRYGLNQVPAAVDLLHDLLTTLPMKHAVAQEGRILLCRIRHAHPEIGASPRRGGPIKVEGEVLKPVRIYSPDPQYPEVALRAREQGQVTVQAIIDRDGCVIQTQIVESDSKDLSFAAEEAVRKWAFLPATLNGGPVDVYFNLTINFGLRLSH